MPEPGSLAPAEATGPAPLTRREARMLEASRGRQAERPGAETRTAVGAQPRTPLRADPPAMKTRPKATVRNHSVRSSTVRSRLRPLASFGVMLVTGALAVGMSLPANALLDAEAVAAARTAAEAVPEPAVAGPPAQSIEVSADIVQASSDRDEFGTLSYAEVLRLRYQDIPYSFAATSGSIRWPFPYSTTISDGFGPRDGGFHKGVDFTPGGGSPIYAIADGIATVVDDGQGVYGTHVVITHQINGQRVTSLYAHMVESSTPLQQGQLVEVGDFLGLVGDTGLSFGAHLHLEIHVDGVPVDPFIWLTVNATN